MSLVDKPLSGFEFARLRITNLKLGDPSELAPAVRRTIATSALSLKVQRVGVWIFSEDRQCLVALHLVGTPELAGEVAVLPVAKWPKYSAYIDERRVLAVDDAQADPRTSELVADYLAPLGITALLDVPIFISGEVWGMLCHEHEGGPRGWTRPEIDFAISVADMLSALFEQSARLTCEKELRARDAKAAKERQNDALVRMAAGVAHDFNTVLQTVLLLAESATRTRQEDPTKALSQIKEECGRGSRIVRQLLDFARPTPHSMAPLDLAELVTDLRPAIEALTFDAVEFDVRMGREVMIDGNRAQLEQAILNLVVNARDAMPEGGTLRVGVGVDGEEACVSVSDEGTGVADDVREHIFEPFFTTKSDQGGTGLGLATVAVVAEQHGGRVSVAPGESRGTTFTVRIPRVY